jgi:hypothetical protein
MAPSLFIKVFNYSVLLLVLLVVAQGYSGSLFDRGVKRMNSLLGFVIAVALVLFIGLRPVVPYAFGDTYNYALSFWNLEAIGDDFTFDQDGDLVFNALMMWFARNGNFNIMLIFCSFVYVGGLWWALVRLFRADYFVAFVVAIGMFSFLVYGVNGMRNGMAASIMILALSFRKRIVVAIILTLLAAGIHRSITLIAAAAAITLFIRQPRVWIGVWVGSIAVSLLTGSTISNWLITSGLISDDRFTSYLTEQTADEFSYTGFRWDFLLFSSLPVAIGSWFVFDRGYRDRIYLWLFNIYLITNAFWILVIRANFSNRFAQISWFIMPLVLIYPFLMHRFWPDQSVKTGTVVIVSYLYTFYTAFL